MFIKLLMVTSVCSPHYHKCVERCAFGQPTWTISSTRYCNPNLSWQLKHPLLCHTKLTEFPIYRQFCCNFSCRPNAQQHWHHEQHQHGVPAVSTADPTEPTAHHGRCILQHQPPSCPLPDEPRLLLRAPSEGGPQRHSGNVANWRRRSDQRTLSPVPSARAPVHRYRDGSTARPDKTFIRKATVDQRRGT